MHKGRHQAVHDTESEIYHDATQWRHRAVEHAMLETGLSAAEARMGANAVMMSFAKWRNCIEVPQPMHDALKALVRKWPLAAIVNGNAQLKLLGPDDYFEFVLRAGLDGRSKLFSGICTLAAEKPKMLVGETLYVDDDLMMDTAGAICCGMQTCRIKPENADLMQTTDSRLLPHTEISQLASLTSLI